MASPEGQKFAAAVKRELDVDFTTEQRRLAAAEFIAAGLATFPEQYHDPWMKSALKAGVEATLGLRDLPEGEA